MLLVSYPSETASTLLNKIPSFPNMFKFLLVIGSFLDLFAQTVNVTN